MTHRTVLLDIETAPRGWRAVRDALRNGFDAQHFAARDGDWDYEDAPLSPEAFARAWATLGRKDVKDPERAAAKMLEWWAGGALDAARGEVVCVGLMEGDADPMTLVVDEAGEHDLLRRVDDALGIYETSAERLVAHNGIGFDFPFLWQRATVHAEWALARRFVRLLHYGTRMEMQNGTKNGAVLIDTMQLWTSTDRRTGLAAAAEQIGVVVTDDPLAGPDPSLVAVDAALGRATTGGARVLWALLQDRMQNVREHCAADLRRLRAVWTAVANAHGILE